MPGIEAGLGALLGGPGGAALLSFLPGLLGKLGVFGEDPAQKLRREIMQLTSPQNVARLTNQNYQQFLQSPGYSQAQTSVLGGANAAGNQLRSSLGSRGLASSGIGALANAIQGSTAGLKLGGLQAQGYQSAQQQTQDMIRQQIAALTGTAGPSQNTQLLSAGLAQFGNFLLPKLLGGTQAGGGINFLDYLNQRPQLPGLSLYNASQVPPPQLRAV